MMLDVIAVIFIVALSFILCMKDGNYNCQMSHIVIGLSVMVFYKLAKVLKLHQTTKESFDTTADLNAFISGNVVGNVAAAPNQLQTLSTSDLAAYNSKLDALITAINNLYNQQSNPQPNLSVDPNNIQKLDLESQQQYQMFQIDYLNKQIQNAKDIINAQTIANNNTNYKPIKVYSSCVISNADGTTSLDTPVNAAAGSSTAFLQPALAGNSSQSGGGASASQVGGAGSSLGNNTGTATTKANTFVNLSPSTGAFGNLLNSLANGQGNININV
jgi:hypothetical protein